MKLWTLGTYLFFFCSLPLASEESNDALHVVDNIKASKGFQKGQFLAVPIPISNPTIGSGLQFALLYMHGEDPEDKKSATSGIGGMYTDSKSWFAGAFHDGSIFNERILIRGALGTGEMNLEYFFNDKADTSIPYSLEADVALIQGLTKLTKNSDWYMGLRLFGLNPTVSYDFDQIIPGAPELSADTTVVNLALVLNHDRRDNSYYPSAGNFFQVSYGRDDENIGSDYNFSRLSVEYKHYIPLNPKHVLAMRVFVDEIDGKAPFFLQPSLKMRGFSSFRYQDDAATSAHIEWRYKFHSRWGTMLSFEAGRVGDSLSSTLDGETITSVGAGVRWQATKNKPLHLGFEVGASDDDTAFYIRVGEKF